MLECPSPFTIISFSFLATNCKAQDNLGDKFWAQDDLGDKF